MQAHKVLLLLGAFCFCNFASAQSTGHIGHGGAGGGSDCIKAKMTRNKPENMATIAPGGEFSFAASGSKSPEHVHVSIKNQPIAVTVEDKDTFYLVHGKLPEDIKNTVVRISVKLKSKFSRCDFEGGWLVKVSE
jgi:hypothetical protein